MSAVRSSVRPEHPARALVRFRVWHFALLVAFVAVSISDIQYQGIREPALIALAAAGLAGYAVVGWLGWQFARRFEPRLGRMRLLIVYMIAMAIVYAVAVVIYLALEFGYRTGRF